MWTLLKVNSELWFMETDFQHKVNRHLTGKKNTCHYMDQFVGIIVKNLSFLHIIILYITWEYTLDKEMLMELLK